MQLPVHAVSLAGTQILLKQTGLTKASKNTILVGFAR